MIERVLQVLGRDRAFELFEYLIIFFVLLSLATLGFLLAYEIRARNALRRTNGRFEEVVSFLGRSLFGEQGWSTIEHITAANGKRMDSLLSLFDPQSFEQWAHQTAEKGLIDEVQIDDLRERLTQPPEFGRPILAEAGFSECVPTSGMPIAAIQGELQARGTIAEVNQSTITIWILDTDDGLDAEKPVSFMLLSRSGPYTFEANMRRIGDGILVVERPPRIVRAQRRRFRRRPASLPAKVRAYLDGSSPADAIINELSGGGATLTNPNHAFTVGNVLSMSFSAGTRQFDLAGRVVRTSDNSSRLHVRFEAMKDQQREDIAEYVALTDLTA
jgi:hypothetical protein